MAPGRHVVSRAPRKRPRCDHADRPREPRRAAAGCPPRRRAPALLGKPRETRDEPAHLDRTQARGSRRGLWFLPSPGACAAGRGSRRDSWPVPGRAALAETRSWCRAPWPVLGSAARPGLVAPAGFWGLRRVLGLTPSLGAHAEFWGSRQALRLAASAEAPECPCHGPYRSPAMATRVTTRLRAALPLVFHVPPRPASAWRGGTSRGVPPWRPPRASPGSPTRLIPRGSPEPLNGSSPARAATGAPARLPRSLSVPGPTTAPARSSPSLSAPGPTPPPHARHQPLPPPLRPAPDRGVARWDVPKARTGRASCRLLTGAPVLNPAASRPTADRLMVCVFPRTAGDPSVGRYSTARTAVASPPRGRRRPAGFARTTVGRPDPPVPFPAARRVSARPARAFTTTEGRSDDR